MKRYFTSDLHFSHANIIKYCDRPYKSVEQMNADIIRRWNNVITPEDLVYIIGDFGYINIEEGKDLLSQLNGSKILILGNHDDNLSKCEKMGFLAVVDSLEIELCKIKFKLYHYPYFTWKDWFGKYIRGWNLSHFDRRHFPGDEDVLLHGHVHNRWGKHNKAKTMINVCWDVWNRPVGLNEIISILKKGQK